MEYEFHTPFLLFYVIIYIGDNMEKVDIELKKVDILLKSYGFTPKTSKNIQIIYNEYKNNIFGRTDIIKILDYSNAGASKFIKQLLDRRIIIPVRGYGKGKYRFGLSWYI